MKRPAVLSALLAALLGSYFRLGSDVTPAPGAPAGDPPAGDDDLPPIEDDDPPPGDGGEPPPPDPDKLMREATARAEKAEREARENAARIEALERERANAGRKSPDQVAFEEEEAALRNPATSADERWRIQANRELRANRRMAENAETRAVDLSDKTAYDRLCMDATQGGKIAKKYAERVEKKLTEIRASGGNLPRKFVLQMLVGEDYVEGRVTTKKPPAPEPKPVPRGKAASPRGDVSGKSTPSEREARRARLENQPI